MGRVLWRAMEPACPPAFLQAASCGAPILLPGSTEHARQVLNLALPFFGSLLARLPARLPACLPACLRLCAEGSDVAVRTQRSRDLCKRFMVAYHKLAWLEAVHAAKALLRAGTPYAGYQSQAMREARRQLDAEADAAATAARRTRRRTSGGAGAGEGGAAAVCTASLDRWGQPQVQVSEGEWPACRLPACLQVGTPGQWQGAHLPV